MHVIIIIMTIIKLIVLLSQEMHCLQEILIQEKIKKNPNYVNNINDLLLSYVNGIF